MRCIDFGGWEMPVQFVGIQREHDAVRQRAGLFDVSHMGELMLTGPEAGPFLQRVTTNDVARLRDGETQYSLLCYEDGGVVDDLLVYRLAADRYMLVVNASNTDKDAAWLREKLPPGVAFADVSDQTALLALQGPRAGAILARAGCDGAGTLAPFHFIAEAQVAGHAVLLSRTGYTGEDGFELYMDAGAAPAVWSRLIEAGTPEGLLPAGLGARDTLRFEARLPLYGQELSAAISPLEAGLGRFVKLGKGDFIGRDALLRQQEGGVPRKLVGLEMTERGIPRPHYAVYAGERQIGEVTTGTQSPTLKRNLGLALVETASSAVGTELLVDIRGKRLKAVVVETPFYRRSRA